MDRPSPFTAEEAKRDETTSFTRTADVKQAGITLACVAGKMALQCRANEKARRFDRRA
jgi:hypothetical protein